MCNPKDKKRMDKPINSHVQIPKAIMKNFSFKEIELNEDNKPVKCDMVYYLDIKCQAVKTGNIKSLGTIEGYYSPDMEEFLGTRIEGPLGDLMKNAWRFYQDKISQYNINDNSVIDFAHYAFLRSKLVLNEVNKPDIVKDFLQSVGYNTEKTQEDLLMHPEALNGIFDNYVVKVFENHSAVDLVVPRNCIYYMERTSGHMTWFIPFSPRLAFNLVDKHDAYKFQEGCVLYHDDDELIRKMNRHALECEIRVNNEFIVSKRMEELEELIPLLHNLKYST